MSATLPLARRPTASVWQIASTVMLAGAVAALLYLTGRIVLFAIQADIWALGRGAALWSLLIAGGIYLIGHAFRILRLALLIGGWRVGFREIASFHLMTAAVSLTAPLKLGELYRAVEMANVTGSIVRALAIAWCERTLDVIVLLVLLMLGMSYSSGDTSEFGAVLVLAGAFTMATAVAFFILPDNLRRLAVLIIRRYDDPSTVGLLRVIDMLRRAILEAPNLVRGKMASLATLTAFIWLSEIACFSVAIPSLGRSVHAGLDALLTFLSALTRGETLLGVLASDKPKSLGVPPLSYLVVTQVPLAFLGLAAAVAYVRRRRQS